MDFARHLIWTNLSIIFKRLQKLSVSAILCLNVLKNKFIKKPVILKVC